MKKRAYFMFAMGFAVLLMLYPKDALEASAHAMSLWAVSFAPSLFLFFAILPALTSREALHFYEWALGRVMPPLFGCPGAVAAAVFVGWIAGSPAGAIAMRNVAAEQSISAASLRRAALLSAGVSPMFLTAAIGVGLLGNDAIGMVLVRSQIGAMLLSGLILKHFWKSDTAYISMDDPKSKEKSGFMREAVVQMITVCGWMILFAVIARFLSKIPFMTSHEAPLLALLEVTGGAAAISQLALDFRVKATLICATCCFGGISIMSQNMQHLKHCSVKWKHMVAIKTFHAVAGALFCWIQMPAAAPQSRAVLSYGMAAQASLGQASILVVLVTLGCLAYGYTKKSKDPT